MLKDHDKLLKFLLLSKQLYLTCFMLPASKRKKLWKNYAISNLFGFGKEERLIMN